MEFIVVAFVALLIYGKLSRKSSAHPANMTLGMPTSRIISGGSSAGDSFVSGSGTIAAGVAESSECPTIPQVETVLAIPADLPPPLAIQQTFPRSAARNNNGTVQL